MNASKKPWHRHFETIGSITAIIVGVAALLVTWDQGRVMRAQQHGAVYPVLQVDGFVSNTPERSSLGITVRNSGVGPALIESVELLHNGQPADGFDEYRAQLPAGYDLSWAGLAGRALAPGEDITPISFLWDRSRVSEADVRAAAAKWDSWRLQICYCSVFGHCWRTHDLGGARAEPVRACSGSSRDIFEDLGTSHPEPDNGDPS